MKKFYLFVCLFLCFNVYASEGLNDISIEYQNNSITTSTRSYSNNRYVFLIDYTGDINNLSDEQLDFILKQESSDYLRVFGNINVRINPNSRGVRNNGIFVGYSGGMFGNSLYEDVIPNDVAHLENLSFSVLNPILDVYYRQDENSAWSNDKGSLSGVKTIEEQLSELLNIPVGMVKDKYMSLYYFKPFEDSVYTNRFDFYEGSGITMLAEGNDYDVSGLNKINYEYALLKFDYASANVFLESENNFFYLPYVIISALLVCLISFYFFRKKGFI